MKKVSTYERWMDSEGIGVVRGFGVEDLASLELDPWARTSGSGTFVDLRGMEGVTGAYVVEIPPGGSLLPERHVYEEILYVISGHGALEVWTADDRRALLEWTAGSLFAVPLNARHQLHNGGNEPARLFAATTAPLVFDLFRSPGFVFDCEHVFAERFKGDADFYATMTEHATDLGWVYRETNHVANVVDVPLASREQKGAGVRLTVYEMVESVLVAHLADWPVGRYHKAHFHGGGAILLILSSRGYTLLWPRDVGPTPYASGHGDKVVRVDWSPGSVLCPPSGWFHQHFNTGPVPARQLALRLGSKRFGVRFYDVQDGEGINVSVRDGGSLIEYADEDPAIRRQFIESLDRNGIAYAMSDAAPVSG